MSEEINIKKNKSLFNKWARTYDFSPFQFWMRGFQRPVFKELNLAENIKLLDISCGTGELLKKLESKNTKAELFGIDLADNMLKKARTKLKFTKLETADVHKLPFKDNTFDYTVSTEAFHHYFDQEQALNEMKRVTRPEGKIIVVDINFFLRPFHRLFEKFEPGCVKVNSKKEMKKLFQSANLKEIRQKRSFIFAIATVGIKN